MIFLVDCIWLPPIETLDCKKEQEEYFKREKDEKAKGYGETAQNCFLSQIVLILAEHNLEKELNSFVKELAEMIKGSGEKKTKKAFPRSIEGVKSLQKLLEDENDWAEKIQSSLYSAWTIDREIIIKLTLCTVVKWAKIPILDGLYGGKSCIRATDSSKIVFNVAQ